MEPFGLVACCIFCTAYEQQGPSCSLHGPSMFAVKAKIYGVLYKQSSSMAFDETSSYWFAPKNS